MLVASALSHGHGPTTAYYVILRMLILTSKLLKEPSNRTIDVIPYF